jgi:hypothetical protein
MRSNSKIQQGRRTWHADRSFEKDVVGKVEGATVLAICLASKKPAAAIAPMPTRFFVFCFMAVLTEMIGTDRKVLSGTLSTPRRGGFL